MKDPIKEEKNVHFCLGIANSCLCRQIISVDVISRNREIISHSQDVFMLRPHVKTLRWRPLSHFDGEYC